MSETPVEIEIVTGRLDGVTVRFAATVLGIPLMVSEDVPLDVVYVFRRVELPNGEPVLMPLFSDPIRITNCP